ncbi:hypothetical protein ABIE26_000848 [Pedobacter africanus]|uniref:Uncharacterized protein n=1 Tax=Pedobacter africanus TaxID=151894 RepID=A0ACC6KTK4_9SPHI|nr:hypothetical protein [Pedobacter africanus]MDR6782664.1 hypothetical protein [Pedobacter africanus]
MKLTYKILLVFIISVAAVVTLYLVQPRPKKNGFKRGHRYAVQKLDSLELKFGGWYITWQGKNRIYLSNSKAVLALFSCNYNLQDTVYGKLSFADARRLRLAALKARIVKQLNPGEDPFKSDGFVNLDEATGRMVYTYYYRNAFVYLDTGLNLLYKGKLIDTNSLAKIELGAYKAGSKTIRTMAKPALVVNKKGYVDGNYFYNHAALAADNESLEDFNRHEVFDVYKLDSGKYKYSFYVPRYKGRMLTDFAVQDNMLIALYERYLVTYALAGKEVRQAN